VESSSWLGLLGSVALLVAANVARKYVIPFLQVGKRQKYAEYIATIADEVMDDLKQTYPEKAWLKHLDEAVERLAAICGISADIARRAVNAAVSRRAATDNAGG
jgi:hypothetical protein